LILTIQLTKIGTSLSGYHILEDCSLLRTRTETTAYASLVREKQRAERESSMKNKIDTEIDDELRAEYDLSQLTGGVRGKYVQRYKAGTNLVLLAPDVAEAFPSDEAVNEALRLLIRIARTQLEQGVYA
jgi:hypothetical protein